MSEVKTRILEYNDEDGVFYILREKHTLADLARLVAKWNLTGEMIYLLNNADEL